MKKTILITGGSRGIGKATAKKFLENNYKIITTSTSGKLDYSHEDLTVYKYDQGDTQSVKKLAEDLNKVGFKIDVLINNAAIMLDWQLDQVDTKVLDKTLAVNLQGLIDLTQDLLGIMNQDGLIINVSSALGALTEEMGTTAPAYSISKAALNMYTRKLHAKVNEAGLSVISYEPGWVKTDMGGQQAPREVGEPAEELYKLSTQDPRPKSGLFYNGDGVREW